MFRCRPWGLILAFLTGLLVTASPAATGARVQDPKEQKEEKEKGKEGAAQPKTDPKADPKTDPKTTPATPTTVAPSWKLDKVEKPFKQVWKTTIVQDVTAPKKTADGKDGGKESVQVKHDVELTVIWSPEKAPAAPEGGATAAPAAAGHVFTLTIDKLTASTTISRPPDSVVDSVDSGAKDPNTPLKKALAAVHGKKVKVTLTPVKAAAPKGTEPKGGTPKGTDPKDTTPKGTDPKGTTPKGAAPKGSDPKGTDPKGTDPKGSDPKGSDKGTTPKGTDPKGTEPKGTEPKADDPKGADPDPAPMPAAKGADTVAEVTVKVTGLDDLLKDLEPKDREAIAPFLTEEALTRQIELAFPLLPAKEGAATTPRERTATGPFAEYTTKTTYKLNKSADPKRAEVAVESVWTFAKAGAGTKAAKVESVTGDPLTLKGTAVIDTEKGLLDNAKLEGAGKQQVKLKVGMESVVTEVTTTYTLTIGPPKADPAAPGGTTPAKPDGTTTTPPDKK